MERTAGARFALTDEQATMADGSRGAALQFAMRLILLAADALGAERLIPITSAHIDACLYTGRAGLDFAEFMAGNGARARVPATLNVASLDLRDPASNGVPEDEVAASARLVAAYERMGCERTLTCSPYYLPSRPGLGDQIAWAESNAIVFANSVLGARTERYGDFLDVAAAVTGVVPDAGLHRTENRAARVLFRTSGLPAAAFERADLPPLLGYVVGQRCGTRIPAIEGLPDDLDEDALKALGTAAASSGSVALFHAVGLTPEAPTGEAAFQGRAPEAVFDVTMDDLRRARSELGDSRGPLAGVCLSGPHLSLREIARLVDLLDGRRVRDGVHFSIATARWLVDEIDRRGWRRRLEEAGVTVVTDICTYYWPRLTGMRGVIMTSSAKWAYYAPGNLGVTPVLATLEECVRSAQEGRVVRDDGFWSAA